MGSIPIIITKYLYAARWNTERFRENGGVEEIGKAF